MTTYIKLFGSILESTVWLESPPVKVVWITLLAMADRDGVIEASIPGLAKRAGVERAHCEQALSLFLAPDPDSRTQEHEGRRLEVVPGGWRLLNYDQYRARASREEAAIKNAARQRRFREKSRAVTPVTQNNTIEEEEEDRRKKVRTESAEPLHDSTPELVTFPTVGKILTWSLTVGQVAEWSTAYPNLAIEAECRKALAWIGAHPERRKTARGMPRFLVGWLNRSVDRGGTARVSTAASSATPTPASWRVDCQHQPMCRTSMQHALACERQAAATR